MNLVSPTMRSPFVPLPGDPYSSIVPRGWIPVHTAQVPILLQRAFYRWYQDTKANPAHQWTQLSNGEAVAFTWGDGFGGVYDFNLGPMQYYAWNPPPGGVHTLHGEPKMQPRNVTLQGPRGDRTYVCPHGRVVGDISECYGHDAHIHYGPNAPRGPTFIQGTANSLGQDRQSFRYDHKKLTLAAPPTGDTQPGGTSVDVVAGEQYSLTVATPAGSVPATVTSQALAAFPGGAYAVGGDFADASTNGDGSLMVGIVVAKSAGTFSWPANFQMIDKGAGPTGIMGWWAGLSTLAKVAVGVGAATVVGGGGYLLLGGKKKGGGGRRGRRRSVRRRSRRRGRR
jgi:hypothetical protein